MQDTPPLATTRQLPPSSSSPWSAMRPASSCADPSAEVQRLHLARELHDTVLQEFLVVVMQLRRIEDGTHGTDLIGRVDHALQAATRGIDCARRLLVELRSPPAPMTDDVVAVSLPQEVASTLHAVVGHSPLRVTFRCPEALSFPPPIQREIVRIIREAATNVVRHADARRITCLVVRHRGALQVVVNDDGHGFEGADHVEGFGLTGMRERAGLIGASMQIVSDPTHGTTVALTLPIAATLRTFAATSSSSQRDQQRPERFNEGAAHDRLGNR